MEDYAFLKENYILISEESSGSIQWLRDWWNQFSYEEQGRLELALGHTRKMMGFAVPQDFIDGILHFWDFDRLVFRFGDRELVPTLEEIELITGLGLEGNCIQVSTGAMKGAFAKHFKIRHEFLANLWRGTTEIPMKILYELYGSKRRYTDMRCHFTEDQTEDTWRKLSMDAFAVCVLAKVYFPCQNEKFDIAMGLVVEGLMDRKTIVPLILGQILLGISNSKVSAGRFFNGSHIVLYVWAVGHLMKCPVNNKRREEEICAVNYQWRPAGVENKEDWVSFFGKLKNEDITMNIGWSGRKFFFDSPDYPFIRLCGLRGVAIYYPSAVLNQFGCYQKVPKIAEDGVHRDIIRKRKAQWDDVHREWNLLRMQVVKAWEVQGYSQEYREWVQEEKNRWMRRQFYPSQATQEPSSKKRNIGEGSSSSASATEIEELKSEVKELEKKLLIKDSMLETRDRESREKEERIIQMTLELERLRKRENDQTEILRAVEEIEKRRRERERDQANIRKITSEVERVVRERDEYHAKVLQIAKRMDKLVEEEQAGQAIISKMAASMERMMEEERASQAKINQMMAMIERLKKKIEADQERIRYLETLIPAAHALVEVWKNKVADLEELRRKDEWEMKKIRKQLEEVIEERKDLKVHLKSLPEGHMTREMMRWRINLCIEEIEGGIGILRCSNSDLVPTPEEVEKGGRLVAELKRILRSF